METGAKHIVQMSFFLEDNFLRKEWTLRNILVPMKIFPGGGCTVTPSGCRPRKDVLIHYIIHFQHLKETSAGRCLKKSNKPFYKQDSRVQYWYTVVVHSVLVSIFTASWSKTNSACIPTNMFKSATQIKRICRL